jgi:YHS domain-containing protein
MPSLNRRHLSMALMLMVAPVAVAISTPAAAIVPGSTSAVNVDQSGLALRGYDPVAYLDGGKPTKGLEAITATYNGARYQFSSEEHRKTFLANPAHYIPQFGGFCAVGTSFGEKVDGDPETGRVVNGKLYVNFNAKAQTIFNKDAPGTINRAEQNWPTVKDKAE